MRPLTLALLAAALFTHSAEAADRYIVATRTATRDVSLRVLRDSGEVRSHAVRSFHTVNAFAATLTPSEVAELQRSPDVRFVTPVVRRQALSEAPATLDTPTNTPQHLPYGVAMIHAPEVWKVTKGSRQVNVAILDTGIDLQHADLESNYAGGYNTFVNSGDPNPTDDNGHGTHVAGTVGAADNDIGVVGVAPEVRIWSVKVLDQYGYGYDENIAAGADWVINKKRELGGDWIISMSLGAEDPSKIEEEVFQRAIADGILVTAAAGNRGTADIDYPAAYDGVIAVGAVNSNGTLASFSEHGPRLNIVAPGVSILSSWMKELQFAGVALDSGPTFAAGLVLGSSRAEIKAPYISCGTGNPQDFPADVKGKIALIQRGDITFNAKVRNAEAAGAVGVVIVNQDDSDYWMWSLYRPNCPQIAGCDDATRNWPVVLALSASDGQRLLSETSPHVIDLGSWIDDYEIMSGTSQATPHVAGALALIWSLDPGVSASAVKDALLSSATDLGAPGFDETYGNGLVNVLAAAKKLTPWLFDSEPVPSTPDTQPAIP